MLVGMLNAVSGANLQQYSGLGDVVLYRQNMCEQSRVVSSDSE